MRYLSILSAVRAALAAGWNATVGALTVTTVNTFVPASGMTLAKDTDGTLAANSDSNVATQKATKTYADTKAPIAAPTFTGVVTDAGTLQHGQSGGQEDLYGTVDPTLGSGVSAPIGSIYHRQSAVAGGPLSDEWIKFGSGNTNWTRTKRSPMLAGGVWAAATYPATLKTASAVQERDVNRAILADQTFSALPAALFQCDEAANGDALDVVGGSIAITSTGGDATRAATAYADGVIDRALVTVKDSDNWWKITDTTKLDPGSGAFVLEIITKVTSGLAALTGGFVGKYNNAGWLAEVLSGDGRIQAFFSSGGTATLNLIFNHVDGNFHRILIGRSVTNSTVFVTSDLGDTTGSSAGLGSLGGAWSFGLGANSTTHKAGASQTATKIAFYTGADAEAVYTNRVALCARWATT